MQMPPKLFFSTEDGIHSMSVIHYSDDLVELLKPQNITSTHVTVSIPGTSRFRLTRILNWFKEIIHCHAIPLYLQIPHKLLVFLQRCNVDPRKVRQKDLKINQEYLPFLLIILCPLCLLSGG